METYFKVFGLILLSLIISDVLQAKLDQNNFSKIIKPKNILIVFIAALAGTLIFYLLSYIGL